LNAEPQDSDADQDSVNATI